MKTPSFLPRPSHSGRLARRMAHAGANRLFDHVYGTVTHSPVPLSQLTLVSDGAEQDLADRRYEGAPVLTFISLMRTLPANREDFTFIDYGSGKGRAVLLAAVFGFKRVVGVEFARELHEIATRNVRSCRRKKVARQREIALTLGDAMDYEIPDGPCVFFLYNPFPEHVLSEVVERIEQSYRDAPRCLHVVYLNPRFSRPFDDSTFLHLAVRKFFIGLEAAVYRTPQSFER